LSLMVEESGKAEESLRSCKRCSHLAVCSVYRAVAPLINSFEIRKPLNPDDLAKICVEFTLLLPPTTSTESFRRNRR